jgi:hypothetical protein
MAKTTKTKRAWGSSATVHDQKLARGEGGELHQTASGDIPVLTTAQGGPISDDQNSLKIGPRGPTLLEDFHFREKIFHFDHERIPERVVHARGYGAHGYFENYKPLSKYTRADLFQDFVADAFAHCKFIGYVDAAQPLLQKAGISSADMDEGCLALETAKSAKGFVDGLGKLRVWGREPNVKLP